MLLNVSNLRRSLKSEVIELQPGDEGALPGVDEEVEEEEDPGESRLLPGDRILSGLNSSLVGGAGEGRGAIAGEEDAAAAALASDGGF